MAGTHAGHEQGDLQTLRGRGHDPHLALPAEVVREGRLEGDHLRTAGELAGTEHIGDRRDAVGVDRRPREG